MTTVDAFPPSSTPDPTPNSEPISPASAPPEPLWPAPTSTDAPTPAARVATARAGGTRRRASMTAFAGLVGGLAAGGVVAAVALSVSSADGASGAGGSAGQSVQVGTSSSLPLDDQGTGQGALVGPGTGVPDAASHGS